MKISLNDPERQLDNDYYTFVHTSEKIMIKALKNKLSHVSFSLSTPLPFPFFFSPPCLTALTAGQHWKSIELRSSVLAFSSVFSRRDILKSSRYATYLRILSFPAPISFLSFFLSIFLAFSFFPSVFPFVPSLSLSIIHTRTRHFPDVIPETSPSIVSRSRFPVLLSFHPLSIYRTRNNR